MTQAGAVCQDCHGQMAQVGNDFSRNLPGGKFIIASDFYTNPSSASWVKSHGDFAESSGLSACAACHGAKGEGTDLAVTQDVRSGLKCESGATCTAGSITLAADTAVDCGMCHDNPYTNPKKARAAAK